ncbi:hypothetical protein K8I61_08940 [bacterium]|nr:hypothetical protein [bacterium]
MQSVPEKRRGDDSVDIEKKPRTNGNGKAASLDLTLRVTDPVVVDALAEIEDLVEREERALVALKIGVLALRQGADEAGALRVRHEGERLLAELATTFKGSELTLRESIHQTLAPFLDKERAESLPQQLSRLFAADGELARLLSTHVGSDGSVIVATLEKHLGKDTPLFRLLDPEHTDGLPTRMQTIVEEELAAQRKQILAAFDLNDSSSTLSLLVAKMNEAQGDFRKGVGEDIDTLKKQLSLNVEDSAISVMNKVLTRAVEEIVKKQSDFQTEVRALLESEKTRREVEKRTPLHGDAFEVAAVELIRREAEATGDLFEAVGAIPGLVGKKGDALVILPPDHSCAGQRIVYEIKDDKSYTDRKVLTELQDAKRNRDASIGVFVRSRETAASGEPLRRFGEDLVVVWDPEDPASDVYLKAAVSVARALVHKKRFAHAQLGVNVEAIDRSIAHVEELVKALDDITTLTKTIRNNSDKIQKHVDKTRESILEAVRDLHAHFAGVKTALESGGE